MATIHLKEAAIQQVRKNGRLIADVSKEFGIANRTLYSWLQEQQSDVELQMLFIKHKIKELKLQLQVLSSELEKLED
jgi:transposase-like protein